MTVLHRIEGGGTEFPMMQMNGSPSLGLNLHEGGHSYLMGILADNEWREGWMDEGFTSFQTSWYEELQARNDGATRGLEVGILASDLDGASQPVSTGEREVPRLRHLQQHDLQPRRTLPAGTAADGG